MSQVGVVKSLAATEGYLELDMPVYALQELDRMSKKFPVEAFAGFSPIVNLLHGRALMAVERYDEAIAQLKTASAQLAPDNGMVLKVLSQCYRLNGQVVFADRVAKVAAKKPDCGQTSIFRVEEHVR